jgi:hypothetical protein
MLSTAEKNLAKQMNKKAKKQAFLEAAANKNGK